MHLSFGSFLESVINFDILASNKLTIKLLDCEISAIEVIKADEPVALRPSCLVSHDASRSSDSELGEDIF